jgi:cyclomaltodextrinase / maltogenic alpha-amylase / neopullulanase
MTTDFVPAWARRAIWYQIFPERFRNGDLTNDPTLETIHNSYPHDDESDWQVHPWTSDWYELQPYEKENEESIWFNLQRRRYGGDIQGIIDKLDYLHELGVTALYLNPMFESPSLHKYDGATFHHIDPNFGPDPIGDRNLIARETPDDPSTWVWTSADKLFLKLLEDVHRRDMRLILDGVFNHVGLNFWAFKDVQKHQQASRFKDWFTVRSWRDETAGTNFQYDGWIGIRELPEFREDEHGNYTRSAQDYIWACTERWMKPNGDITKGIDGWRLDVAFWVSHTFWKAWRAHVKSINPDAYLTAEIIDTIEVNQPFLQGDEFDAVMNYNFSFLCQEFFIDREKQISASDFDDGLSTLRKAYPDCTAGVMQNLFGSHDTARLASHIVNRDQLPYRNFGVYAPLSKGSDENFIVRKPTVGEVAIQKLVVLFQFTYLGAPMIYYGDECGMWGANDPCCRKPMVWGDLVYADESFLPDGTRRASPDNVAVNTELLAFYKRVIALRKKHEALQTGSFKTEIVDNARRLFGFSRESGTEKLLVIFNSDEHTHEVKLPSGNAYRDVFDAGVKIVSRYAEWVAEIPARSAAVLLCVNLMPFRGDHK